MAVPDSLEHKLELFREHGRVFRYNEELFELPSWVAVMLGQQIVPKSYDPLVDTLPDNELIRAMTDLRRGYEETALRLPLASDYIRQRLAA
jgi:tryptophan halogenase